MKTSRSGAKSHPEEPLLPPAAQVQSNPPVAIPVQQGSGAQQEAQESSTHAVDVDDRSFADVVALVGERGFKCSGIVVRADFVLSARHCLPVDEVRVGAKVSQPLQVRKVLGSFVPDDAQLDVALLRVEPLAGIAPRPRRAQGQNAVPTGRLRVIGFGSNEESGRKGAGTKRFGDVMTLGWGCDAERQRRGQCAPGRDLVVVSPGTVDTCNGDSGGPILEPQGDHYRLVGITSHALGGCSTRAARAACTPVSTSRMPGYNRSSTRRNTNEGAEFGDICFGPGRVDGRLGDRLRLFDSRSGAAEGGPHFARPSC
ncbi:hypothetical protein A7982_13319 [Minicystis rosea]|nr:hypothetical protein A7982_13319 [Minicystis rosea]